jgi:hypothetical protein
VTVNISAAPTVVIRPPTTPSAGLPASFTITVTPAQTNGSAVRNLTVNWGDGTSDSFGAVTGELIASHVYADDGTYRVTARVTDASNNVNEVSTTVTIIPVPRPTIIVTPDRQSAPGGSTITFSIRIEPPTGVGIQSVVIDWGDGTSQSLGGVSGTVSVAHAFPAFPARTYTVTVTVTDTVGQTTSGTTVVSITN